MVEFVKLLNKCCTLFAPYVTSHKIEKEEQERKRYYTRLIWIPRCQILCVLKLVIIRVHILSLKSLIPIYYISNYKVWSWLTWSTWDIEAE